jgi:hypothetical protein
MILTVRDLVDRHRELARWHLTRAGQLSHWPLRELHDELGNALLAEAHALEAGSQPLTDDDVTAIYAANANSEN